MNYSTERAVYSIICGVLAGLFYWWNPFMGISFIASMMAYGTFKVGD